jgi:glycosyltransferase involved in cell wall biosynthesis
MTPTMKISVLVPTYRRPADLARCLAALRAQIRAPEEVLVVARPEDEATHTQLALEHRQNNPFALRVIETGAGGQVAALNRGLDAASGEIIAITDDDAAPRRDWVARIADAFGKDTSLGALGGRDWVFERGAQLDGSRLEVGRVRVTGKIIGNHHLGVGGVREVHMLKGANMTYRRAAVGALRFDTRLRGAGAQMGNDMAFSMSVQRSGWKVLYDPLVAVDHFPAERFDGDGRDARSLTALSDGSYNLHLILQEHLPASRRAVAWWWYAAIGTRVNPGLAHLLLALLRGAKPGTWTRWRALRRGANEARRDAGRTSATPAQRHDQTDSATVA